MLVHHTAKASPQPRSLAPGQVGAASATICIYRLLEYGLHPPDPHVPVTLANKITLGRILLIPVFACFALYYAASVRDGRPDERLWLASVVVFAVAALSDAVDGWIARRFNQTSRLGVILDPLADKLLMMSAILILSFSDWPVKLPLYFVIIFFGREVVAIAGAFIVNHLAGKVQIQPHWTGKVAIFLQIVTVSAAMLQLHPVIAWGAAAATIFSVISFIIYLGDAIGQVKAAGHGNPDPRP
jgi:CDP-diacylglycerol--glycerol-3-phosphate 3-phosphatidyltransferase